MQKKEIIQGLEKIGLTEKEARVYLASLELGESTAQSIAAKATVNRPSTYIAIESLTQKGMMNSFQKGKKRYFVAGKPQQLVYIIEQAKQAILEKEKAAKNLIDSLDQFSSPKKKGSDIEVRFFEGLEGVRDLQEDSLKSDAVDIYEIFNLDEVREINSDHFPDDIRVKIREKFKNHTHIIYTSKNGEHLNLKKRGCQFVDGSKYPILGDITIFGNLVSFGKTTNGKISGFHIKNHEFAETMRTLYKAFEENINN